MRAALFTVVTDFKLMTLAVIVSQALALAATMPR